MPEANILYSNTEANKRLLEPFKEVLDTWSVELQHNFQGRISALDLRATGDLASEWTIRVIARDGPELVAEFAFREYGRILDMRRVNYNSSGGMLNYDKIYDWVLSKVQQGQIKYSLLADKLGVQYTDRRVIHDLTYRYANAGNKNAGRRKARKWYNSTKEANLDTLYQRLQDAMAEAMMRDIREAAETRTAPGS